MYRSTCLLIPADWYACVCVYIYISVLFVWVPVPVQCILFIHIYIDAIILITPSVCRWAAKMRLWYFPLELTSQLIVYCPLSNPIQAVVTGSHVQTYRLWLTRFIILRAFERTDYASCSQPSPKQAPTLRYPGAPFNDAGRWCRFQLGDCLSEPCPSESAWEIEEHHIFLQTRGRKSCASLDPRRTTNTFRFHGPINAGCWCWFWRKRKSFFHHDCQQEHSAINDDPLNIAFWCLIKKHFRVVWFRNKLQSWCCFVTWLMDGILFLWIWIKKMKYWMQTCWDMFQCIGCIQ